MGRQPRAHWGEEVQILRTFVCCVTSQSDEVVPQSGSDVPYRGGKRLSIPTPTLGTTLVTSVYSSTGLCMLGRVLDLLPPLEDLGIGGADNEIDPGGHGLALPFSDTGDE